MKEILGRYFRGLVYSVCATSLSVGVAYADTNACKGILLLPPGSIRLESYMSCLDSVCDAVAAPFKDGCQPYVDAQWAAFDKTCDVSTKGHGAELGSVDGTAKYDCAVNSAYNLVASVLQTPPPYFKTTNPGTGSAGMCMTPARSYWNESKNREKLENSFNGRQSTRFDNAINRRIRAFGPILHRLAIYEGQMSGYLFQIVGDVAANFVSVLSCSKPGSDTPTSFISMCKDKEGQGRAVELGRRYAISMARRNAQIKNLEITEKVQQRIIKTAYNRLRAQRAPLVASWKREQEKLNAWRTCLGVGSSTLVVCPPPSATAPTAAPDPSCVPPPPDMPAMPAPVVKQGNCFTVPILGTTFCGNDFWCDGESSCG